MTALKRGSLDAARFRQRYARHMVAGVMTSDDLTRGSDGSRR
jgi:hypothetical protein